MTKEQTVEVVTRALPYPNQIRDWDLSYPTVVYFTWRGDRFKVYLEGGLVMQIESIFEKGSNLATALSELVKRQWFSMQVEAEATRV